MSRRATQHKRATYPAYKPAGVAWLGDVPEHWEIHRLKHVASVQFSSVDKHTLEGEELVRLCNYVDVYYNDFIAAGIEFMSASATQSEIARLQLCRGDVLVTKDSESWDDIAVPSYVAEKLDGVLCGYHLAHIRPHPRKLLGEYLFRAFRSRGINDQFRVAANGITRFGLGKYWLDNGLFPVPSLDEQRSIAAFLHRETARIDALIEKKRRQIELLQEKRSALISHAVTKGLDPNAPMKDSGIEWLGKIPEHWDLVKLRRITTSRCDGPFGSGLKSNHYANEGVRVVRLQNIRFASFDQHDQAFIDPEYYRELGNHDVLAGDLLIAGLGDDRNPVGRACVAPVDIEPAMVKADCFRFRLNQTVSAAPYMAFQLSTAAAALGGAWATGTTRSRMNLSETGDRPVALPPLTEQRQIADALSIETDKLDALANKINGSIEMLREHRTALISAAVTGKIDVRKEVY